MPELQPTLRVRSILLTIGVITSISLFYYAVFGFLGALLINSMILGLIIAIPVWAIAVAAWILFDEYRTNELHKKSIIERIINLEDQP